MSKKSSVRWAGNSELEMMARVAVMASGFESRKGMCQRWVRQVIQKLYGKKYDKYHKGSAHESMLAWAKSEYAVPPARGSVPGDILYKRGTLRNPHGHVGIRVEGNLVAENSSTRLGRVIGAKGFRTIQEFGEVDLIVRLPVGE